MTPRIDKIQHVPQQRERCQPGKASETPVGVDLGCVGSLTDPTVYKIVQMMCLCVNLICINNNDPTPQIKWVISLNLTYFHIWSYPIYSHVHMKRKY